jgi:hypothetical protein
MKSQNAFFKKALVVFLSLLFALFLLEFVSFLILKSKNLSLGNSSERHMVSAFRGHELNPEYWRRDDTQGKRIHSPDGFRRDQAVKPQKGEKTLRIFILGGSALYGLGSGGIYPFHRSLSNQETISFWLEKLINQEFEEQKSRYRVEVINCGVVGYQTFQHLMYFLETIYEYRPDFLLFFDGHNDFYISKADFNPMKKYGYSSRLISKSFNQRSLFFSLFSLSRFFGRWSHFSKVLEEVMEDYWEKYEACPTDSALEASPLDPKLPSFLDLYEKVAKNTFLRIYQIFSLLSSEYGFSWRVFLQPEIVFEDQKKLSSNDRKLQEITVKGISQEKVEKMKTIRKFLPELMKKNGIPFSDLGEIAIGADSENHLYLDYCHLSVEGSKAVAQQIFQEISGEVQKRVTSSVLEKTDP